MRQFTAIEDTQVERYWQRFGQDWAGWPEVLPDHSIDEIRERYQQLARRSMIEPSQARPAMGAYGAERAESYVMACMNVGMAPSEIDRRMRAPRGTAKRIVLEKWAKDKEQNGGTAWRGSH